jgi:hypothetical protein
MPIGLFLNIKAKQPLKPNPCLESYFSEKIILSESVILVSLYHN